MTRQDIQLDNNAIIIQDGDILWGDSDEQHIADTIDQWQGHDKEFPADGVGVLQYLKSKGQEQQLSRSIKLQLISDQYNVSNPEIKFDANGTLIINPKASR